MFAVELRTQTIRSQSRCKWLHSVSALVAWSKLHSFQLIYICSICEQPNLMYFSETEALGPPRIESAHFKTSALLPKVFKQRKLVTATCSYGNDV